jgi:hemolysin III
MSPDSVAVPLSASRRVAVKALTADLVLRARRAPVAPAATPWWRNDELANSLTHGAGLVLSVVACTFLLGPAARDGLTRHAVGCAIFGFALVALYAASTTYHAAPRSLLKNVLRRLDHAGIYALIAGTYTPIALGPLDGPLGWTLLTVVWGTGTFGAWVKLTAPAETLADSYGPCVGLGWMGVLVAAPLAQRPGGPGVVLWMVAAGVVYTAGLFFYVRDSRPLYHAAWHLFVLGGSACSFVAIWVYVVPQS